MKNAPGYPEYKAFCKKRKKDLQRIARRTCGTHDLSDMETEVWLMANHILQKKGKHIDWENPADQDLLLSYLFQHLVRYTERHLQFAVRLDHWSGDEMEDEPHPLLKKLAASDATEPLTMLLQHEEAAAEKLREPDCHYSIASAYIHLLRHFDNKMKDVAAHLLISVSYCYKHFAKTQRLTQQQHSIPMHQLASSVNFLPGAWRRFRIRRIPVQLTFDFEVEQPLALNYIGN